VQRDSMLLNPGARIFIADWPLRAQRLVAEFRNDCRAILDEEEIKNRAAELRQKSEQSTTSRRTKESICIPRRSKGFTI
jgi:hypothetical protein